MAGALQAMGYSFGLDLIEPNPSVNKRGFFEDRSVLALHEKLIAGWGHDWRALLLPPANWATSAVAADAQREIDDLIGAFSQQPPWGVKDPRLCLTFPLWRAAIDRAGLTAKVIITLRDPSAVAHSLERRDGLPLAVAEMLWVIHCLSAERSTRGLDRTVVHYDELVDRPGDVLQKILHWLDWAPTDGVTGALDFLSSSLRSHLSDAKTYTSALVEQSWAALSSGDIDSAQTQSKLDACYEQLQTILALLSPALDAQHRHQVQLEQAFSESENQRSSGGRVLDEQRFGLLEATKQLGQLQAALEDQQQGFAQAVTMLQERDQQLLAAQQEIAVLKTTLTNDDSTVTDQDAALRNNRGLLKGIDTNLEAGVEDGETKYQGIIDLRVENNSHTRAIRYIQHYGAVDRGPILDVGCSSGYFGEALRAMGYEVWGIEVHPPAIAEAQSRLDQVYAGSLEDFLADPATADIRFQFIVFGDVVEHLVDPEAALAACRPRLTDDGAVIVSIPNVAHRSVRLMLLEGRWDYDETGILDRTHLHFFTRDSLNELLTAAGYRIERFSAVTVDSEATGITINPFVDDLFSTVIRDSEQTVFQFIVIAQPEADETVRQTTNNRFRLRGHHRILCLPPLQESSLFSIRLHDPLQRMREMYGGEFRVAEPHLVTAEDIEWADTVVFQRESNPTLLDLMRRLRKGGKRIVFDIDDLLLDVPSYLSVHSHCIAMKPHLEAALREADAVSVSTMPLAEALSPYNDNIFFTPNYATTHEQPIAHYADVDPVRIIVASSDSVRVDFLVDALKTISADPAVNVELIGIGPPGEFLREQGLDMAVHPLMNHGHFKSFLASRPNTIALIPLDDNRFNRCKSAIKFFDYSLAGVPTICSKVLPYTEVIDSGNNGLLCANNQAAWVDALKELLTNPAQRAQIASSALQRCRTHHNLDRTAARWETLLRESAFPAGDPVHGAVKIRRTAPWHLLRGAYRHATRPASYRALYRALQTRDLRRIWARWKAAS